MNIKELREKLEAVMKSLQDVSAKMASAKAEEVATLEKQHSELFVEAKGIQTQLDDAMVKKEQMDKIQKTMDTSKGAGEPVFNRTSPAQPVDHVQKHVDHESLFRKYLGDGPKFMSGNEMSFLEVKSGSGFDQGSGGASMPLALKLKMFGTKWALNTGHSPADIAHALKAATMVSGTPTLGGYTVPEDFRLPVLDLPPEPPHILQRATVVPAPTGEITMPKSNQTDQNEFGGMTGQWISEAGLKPKTDTTFEQVKIAAYEYAMHTQISHRLLSRSAIAMEQWVATKARQVCLDALDTAFINGDGNGKPLGFLQTAGIRTVVRGTAGAASNDDLVKLKYALRPQHRARGVFVLEDGVLEAFELSKDLINRPLFKNTIANGPYDMIAGYPYISTTRSPALGSDGDVAFIDLSEYYVAMEQDIVVKRSDDFAFTNNVATIAIFVVVGGRLVQPRVCSILADNIS
jgi:HK97 family phage major capsid protein